MITINKIEEELWAIQNSITYCKKEYEKEKNPHIKEKIEHYINGLKKEEEKVLKELRRNE